MIDLERDKDLAAAARSDGMDNTTCAIAGSAGTVARPQRDDASQEVSRTA